MKRFFSVMITSLLIYSNAFAQGVKCSIAKNADGNVEASERVLVSDAGEANIALGSDATLNISAQKVCHPMTGECSKDLRLFLRLKFQGISTSTSTNENIAQLDLEVGNQKVMANCLPSL